jgi:hypothetical protein
VDPTRPVNTTSGYVHVITDILAVHHRTQVEDQIKALTDLLLEQPHIAGYVYTQLTDVEQEVNAVYTYDRKPKSNLERPERIFNPPRSS